jgi:hypothetical protein
MRKKSASGVLASLRGSTYGTEYDSPPRSLRPCWTVFFTHPAWLFNVVSNLNIHNGDSGQNEFFRSLLEK